MRQTRGVFPDKYYPLESKLSYETRSVLEGSLDGEVLWPVSGARVYEIYICGPPTRVNNLSKTKELVRQYSPDKYDDR